MIEISFIIPAYNVETYIGRCLDSIFNQNVDATLYEVIVIDDGSTDGTLNLLNKYATKYSNLNVTSQENKGVSAARNHGIALAKGEYLWFVDSDDYIKENSVQHLIDIVQNTKPSILYFSYIIKNINGTFIPASPQPVSKNILLDGKTALKMGFFPTSVWLALWKRENINHLQLRFNTDIKYAEDSLFSFYALSQSNNIIFVDNEFYIYVKRDGSATTLDQSERVIQQKLNDIEVIKSIKNLAKKYENSDKELSLLISTHSEKILFGLVFSLYRNRKEWKALGVNKDVIKNLKEEGLYPMKGPFDSWKKRLACLLLNIEWVVT